MQDLYIYVYNDENVYLKTTYYAYMFVCVCVRASTRLYARVRVSVFTYVSLCVHNREYTYVKCHSVCINVKGVAHLLTRKRNINIP